jgi:hypothetical protein
MARVLGVENGRLLNVGRFNPPVHRGHDIFAPPGSGVFVPQRTTMRVDRSTFDPNFFKGQISGTLTMCGQSFGFVAAHFGQPIPAIRTYEAGEQLGTVAGGVRFTPHIHWGFNNQGQIPPPGTVDPVPIWRECVF